jgi:hypothetical protein
MMNDQDLQVALRSLRAGATVFISYIPGNAPGATSGARRWFTGELLRAWNNARGELVFSARVAERDGAVRTFNPKVGKLLSLEVIVPGKGRKILP